MMELRLKCSHNECKEVAEYYYVLLSQIDHIHGGGLFWTACTEHLPKEEKLLFFVRIEHDRER